MIHNDQNIKCKSVLYSNEISHAQFIFDANIIFNQIGANKNNCSTESRLKPVMIPRTSQW